MFFVRDLDGSLLFSLLDSESTGETTKSEIPPVEPMEEPMVDGEVSEVIVDMAEARACV